MAALDTLLKKTADAITRPSAAMRRAIATAHTAAYYAGIKERTGVLPKGLSKVERSELKALVQEQLKYYDKFVGETEGMSEAAILARAQLYTGAIKATYYGARWGTWELPFVPSEGTPCGGRCKCSISVADNGDGTGIMTWTLGGDEGVHCTECPARVGDHPVKRRGT